MHARVSVFQMTPDELDAGVEYGQGTIVAMMQMAGFRGNRALLDRETGRPGDRETGRPGDRETGRPGDRETGRPGDRETGRITSITLWESEEAMNTSEERANAMRSSGAATIDGSVVSVDRYEVGYFIQP